MIYINSKDETINNYWKNNFGVQYGAKNIDSEFFEIEQKILAKDILILDIDQFNTVNEVIDIFQSIPKSLKVVAILEQPKLAHGAYLIKKGFKSYLGKKTSKIIVEQAIKTVHKGNVWLYPQLMNYIIKNIDLSGEENIDKSKSIDILTLKEQDIANLVAQGYSNKEISQKLEIQLVTVKKHIGNIFTKLDVKDRVSLAILINSK